MDYPAVPDVVTRMIACVRCRIVGSETSSTRTSRLPCQVTAFIRRASAFHAKATTGTIRAQLINIPARLARSARRLRMHLPQHWPWEQAWSQLFQATLAPPRPA